MKNLLVVLLILASTVINAQKTYTLKVGGGVTGSADTTTTIATKTDLLAKANRSSLRLNVRDFGAVGDGVTNDRAAIQACANAAAIAGKICYIPTGRFKALVPGYNPGANYPVFTLLPGTVIEGDGEASVIFKDSTEVNGYMIFNDQDALAAAPFNKRNYTIRGVSFKGVTGLGHEFPNATDKDGGIAIWGLSAKINSVLIERVSVSGINKEGIAVWFALKCSLIDNSVDNGNFDGLNTAGINRLIVTGNNVSNVSFGFEFGGDGSKGHDGPTYSLIQHNYFTGIREYGMNVESGDVVDILNNQFSGYEENQSVTGLSNAIFITPYYGDVGVLNIKGNTMVGFVNAGILVENATVNYPIYHLNIIGNTIWKTGSTAIQIHPSDSSKLKHLVIGGGNILADWNQVNNGNSYEYCAIALYNTKYASISHNFIYHTDPNGLRNDPLYIQNTNNTVFHDNDMGGGFPSMYSSVLTVRKVGTNKSYVAYSNINLDGNGVVLYQRLTSTERNSLISPLRGTSVYDLTLDTLLTWNGSSWGGLAGSAPQNLVTWSQQFEDPSWTYLVSPIITANAILAPDGTLTADSLKAAPSTFGGILRKAYTFTNQEYTASIHLKKSNYNYVGIRIADVAGAGTLYPFVNLSNGTTNTAGLSGATMSIDTLPDGWYRVSLTFTCAAGVSNFDIALVGSDGSFTITPSGTETVYLWGAQLNTGPKRIYTKTDGTIVP